MTEPTPQPQLNDLVIEECIPNCEKCPSVWVNEQIGHRLVCKCKKCQHDKIQSSDCLVLPKKLAFEHDLIDDEHATIESTLKMTF